MNKIVLKKECQGQWDYVCGMCKHFTPIDGIYNHCCDIDIDTPLRYSGACEHYEYTDDPSYGESYGYPVSTEKEIEELFEKIE